MPDRHALAFDPNNPPEPQEGREALAFILHEQAIGCWYDSHHVRYCEPDNEHHAKHADRLLQAGMVLSGVGES